MKTLDLQKIQMVKNCLPILDYIYSNGNTLQVSDLENWITVNKPMEVGLYAGNIKTKESNFDKFPRLPKDEVFTKTGAFANFETIEALIKCQSKDEVRLAATGIYFDSNCMVATNYTVLKTIPQKNPFENPCIINFTKVLPKLKYLLNFYNVTELEAWESKQNIKFACKDFEIVIRKIDAKYPVYTSVLPELSAYTKCFVLEHEVLKTLIADGKALKKQFGSEAIKRLGVDTEKNLVILQDIDYEFRKEYPITFLTENCKSNANLLMRLTTSFDLGFDLLELEKLVSFKDSVKVFYNEPTRAFYVEEVKKNVPKSLTAPKPTQTPKQKPEPAPEPETPAKVDVQTSLNLFFVDYSEKAIAIFGDTRIIKDYLKEIGARFNAYLKNNGITQAGWIMSKKHFDRNLFANL